MRLIDADALKEYIDAQKGRPFIGCTIGEALKIMVDEQPIIEPRCETCEALNKTRLLIPQPERKTGKWLHNPDPMAGEGFWRCSECGLEAYDYADFCPKCGADMRGEEHGRHL